jgi:small subunit ribosomal protein S1
LSIKAKDEAEEKEAVNNARQAAATQVSEAMVLRLLVI